MADHVALFIDGAYLDYILRDEFDRARLDFTAMANAMAEGADILRTYYYHCLPYQSRLAAKGRIQQAVLLAGDSDFIPAINVAKSEGVLVRLFHGEGCHSELWQAADERVKLDQAFIDSIRQSPRQP